MIDMLKQNFLSLGKSSRGKHPYFCRYSNFLLTQLDSFIRFGRNPVLWQTDRHALVMSSGMLRRDISCRFIIIIRHRPMASTRTSIGSCGQKLQLQSSSDSTFPPSNRHWQFNYEYGKHYNKDKVKMWYSIYMHVLSHVLSLQCFDAVGWAAGRASGL